MSSAFVRENDEQRLNEIGPSLNALLVYLRRENGGMTIRELRTRYSEKHKREVHEMSDGLGYARDDDSKWYVVLDID
jgi:hypothetical protein